MSTADLESTVRQVLATLQTGVRLDWTDLRVYVIVLVASSIGGIAGSWFHAYFSKRGELAAVKKDLEQITRVQEDIRLKVSTAAWVQQNLWTLKKETYWKLTSVLSELSTALWDILQHGFLPDKNVNPNTAVTAPLVQRTARLLDELIALTAPSHIVLSGESVETLHDLKTQLGSIRRDLAGSAPKYEAIRTIRGAVDRAFDRVVDLGKRDLASPGPEERS